MKVKLPLVIFSILLCVGLSACGGGGGKKQPAPTVPPPVDTTMNWDDDNWDEKDWQ